MRIYFFIYSIAAFVWLSALSVLAEDFPTSPHSGSTISETSRYEIVQSHLMAKLTFCLDRFCGSISQLVRTASDGMAWEAMYIERQPPCAMDGKAHYQLFSSSLAARHTFLLNTDTGATWLLMKRENKEKVETTIWSLFE